MNYLELNCEYCGVKILRYEKTHEANLKKGRKTYCSISCANRENKKSAGDRQKEASIETFEQRFFDRVDKTENCWFWKGLKTKRGYGVCKKLGKNITTHRISYEMHKGSIPDGMCVLHKCDNRCCVNPDHLVLGTHQDNLDDMFCKNRHIKGEKSCKSKLTEAQVIEIRNLSKDNTKNQLANMFNVSPHTIYSVVSRRSWKHLDTNDERKGMVTIPININMAKLILKYIPNDSDESKNLLRIVNCSFQGLSED